MAAALKGGCVSRARTGAGRALGRGLVRGMPKLLKLLATVGTAAMLWVGGQIILHGLDVLGWPGPYATIHHWAGAAADAAPESLSGFLGWSVAALCDAAFGLALGLVLIPLAKRVLGPLLALVTGAKGDGH